MSHDGRPVVEGVERGGKGGGDGGWMVSLDVIFGATESETGLNPVAGTTTGADDPMVASVQADPG